MGSFGEDLRAERVSRGIALQDITEVTKISQRHLLALEEDRFRLLPGGILNKGIVRGYAGVVGLNERDWTERFLREYSLSAPVMDDSGWAAFASNVGKARLQRREAVELRMRWIGAITLMAIVCVAAFLTVRYFGVRAGWWSSLLPLHGVPARAQAFSTSFVARLRF